MWFVIKCFLGFGLVIAIISTALSSHARITYNGPDPLKSGDYFTLIVSVDNEYGSVPVQLGDHLRFYDYDSTSGWCTFSDTIMTCGDFAEGIPTTIEMFVQVLDIPCDVRYLLASLYDIEVWMRVATVPCPEPTPDNDYLPYVRK